MLKRVQHDGVLEHTTRYNRAVAERGVLKQVQDDGVLERVWGVEDEVLKQVQHDGVLKRV